MEDDADEIMARLGAPVAASVVHYADPNRTIRAVLNPLKSRRV